MVNMSDTETKSCLSMCYGLKLRTMTSPYLMIIFEIEAKTPSGKDGIGRIWYYHGEELVHGFKMNGYENIQSGSRFGLHFLVEAWNGLTDPSATEGTCTWNRVSCDEFPNDFVERMTKKEKENIWKRTSTSPTA